MKKLTKKLLELINEESTIKSLNGFKTKEVSFKKSFQVDNKKYHTEFKYQQDLLPEKNFDIKENIEIVIHGKKEMIGGKLYKTSKEISKVLSVPMDEMERIMKRLRTISVHSPKEKEMCQKNYELNNAKNINSKKKVLLKKEEKLEKIG